MSEMRCCNFLSGMKMCEGRLISWRGTDGHGGSEWFATCERCGQTT